jgi:transcriptional regulator with XRE-family HTH domain
MSIRSLARTVGVSDSHLSRILRLAEYKRGSTQLLKRIAVSLDLPEDYFPEVREAFVVERIRTDAKLRDDLYKRLRGRRVRQPGS